MIHLILVHTNYNWKGVNINKNRRNSVNDEL